MTQHSRAARAFRHSAETQVMKYFSQTRAGQRATIPQVKAAARKILQNACASGLRQQRLATAAAL